LHWYADALDRKRFTPINKKSMKLSSRAEPLAERYD